jgi:hypothetical protein
MYAFGDLHIESYLILLAGIDGPIPSFRALMAVDGRKDGNHVFHLHHRNIVSGWLAINLRRS